jgi:hypothetical protein
VKLALVAVLVAACGGGAPRRPPITPARIS